jgi:hypothetical protein
VRQTPALQEKLLAAAAAFMAGPAAAAFAPAESNHAVDLCLDDLGACLAKR